MATPSRIRALQQAIENAKANMGRRAADAVGDDIPRPRPTADALPADAMLGIALDTPGGNAPDPAAIAALVRKLETQGPESLDVLEGLELVRAGADPELIFAGSLSRPQAEALFRKVQQGQPLSPEETAALLRTPGDLTDTAAIPDDKLLPSGVDINVSNLTPNTTRTPEATAIADSVWSLTGPSEGESLSPATVRRLAKEVAKYASVADDGTVTYAPEFMQAVRFDRGGKERLDKLAALAEDATRDPTRRAAEQVGEAADARQIASTPRADVPDRVSSAQDLVTARQLLQESMPDGDWNAILAAYSRLDPEQRRAVLAAMPEESGRFVQRMLDPNADDFSVNSNNVAAALRPLPGNRIDELLTQLDAAKRAGDTDAYNNILLDIQTNPADGADAAAARDAFMERQQAAAALRRSIIGNDPLYKEQQTRVLEAAVSTPPPRPTMRPGSRSIEATVADVPEQEMPTAFDTALAAAREAQEARQRRVPQGGMPQDARMRAAGVENARDLPLFLKGSDRADPLESRSRGSRAIEGNDIRVLRPLIAARQKLNAATTAEEQAAAMAEVAQAEAALNRKYRGGREAMSDSRLNKGGQQETYDDLVVSIVGARPKAGRGLSRSSADMTAAERAAMQGEIIDEFGNDALDMLPDEPMLDMDELGEGGRRGRLGGSQAPSRVQGAVGRLFGTYDPLAMKNADGSPVFASAEAVADEVLSRQSVFKPGTANWDYAKEKLTNAINDQFAKRSDTNAMAAARREAEIADAKTAEPPQGSAAGAVREGTDQDPDAVPRQQAAWPDGMMQQTANAPPSASPPNAWDLPEPTGRKTPDFSAPVNEPDDADVASFPQRGAPSTLDAGVSDDLAASSVDLGDVAGDDVPVAASKGGKRGGKRGGKKDAEPEAVSGGDVPTRSREEIAAEIQAEAEERFRQDIADGVSRKKANANRKAYVDEQTAERLKPVTGRAVPESAAPAKPAPEAPSKPAPSLGQDDVDIVDDLDPVSGKNVDEAAEAAPGTSLAKTADGVEPPPGPQPPDKKKGRGWWPYVAGAGVVGGVSGLAQLRNAGGGGFIDIPPPPGGGGGAGGGGVGGGGEFYPMPVDTGSSASAGDAMAQEAAIQRALDRIRGARASTGGMSEPYQTYQNYSIWR